MSGEHIVCRCQHCGWLGKPEDRKTMWGKKSYCPVCNCLAPVQTAKQMFAPDPCQLCDGCSWSDTAAWCNVIGGKWGDDDCPYFK